MTGTFSGDASAVNFNASNGVTATTVSSNTGTFSGDVSSANLSTGAITSTSINTGTGSFSSINSSTLQATSLPVADATVTSIAMVDASGNFYKNDDLNLSPWTEVGSDIQYTGGTVKVEVSTGQNAFVATSGGVGVFSVDGAGFVQAKKLKLKLSGWSDFVFKDDYDLKPLEEVEQFIEENNHLPDVPSEAEVLKEGVEVGEMQQVLLQKIEELTLYIIEQNKEIKSQNDQILSQNREMEKQSKQIVIQSQEIDQLKVLNQLLLEQNKRIEQLERKLTN